MIFQPIISNRQFDIYEGVGCVPAFSNTPLSYILNFAWPLVIGVMTVVYGGGFSIRYLAVNLIEVILAQ